MKTKQIFILAFILGLLVVGIMVKKSQKLPELSTQEYSPLDLSFEAEKISQVTILKQKTSSEKAPEPQVKLVKENGNWKIPGLWNVRADKTKVENLFSEIQKAKGEQRGKGGDLFSDFGIADDQGVQISFQEASGKEILGVILGTKKAGLDGIFLRRKDQDAVYLTKANLFVQIGIYGDLEAGEPSADFWADKIYAHFDAGKATGFEIMEKGAVKLSLSKKAGAWQFGDSGQPFSPQLEKVIQYLSGFKNWPAQTVLDPKAKDYGFAKDRWQIKIEMESGEPVILTVGDPETAEENAFYLQVTGEPVVYLLSKYYFENMRVAADRFFQDNPLQVDPAATEKLVIHADKEEKSFAPAVKKWETLTGYLDQLKNFKVSADVSGFKPKFGKYWIEIQKKGQTPVILDVSDAFVGEQKLYPVQKRGTSAVYGITEALFNTLFQNLSRLDEPAPSPSPSV